MVRRVVGLGMLFGAIALLGQLAAMAQTTPPITPGTPAPEVTTEAEASTESTDAFAAQAVDPATLAPAITATTPARLVINTPTPSPTPTATLPPRLIINTPTPAVFSTVQAAPTGNATASAPVFPITPGSYEGSINDAVPSVRYRFPAQSGTSAQITLATTSGTLDPVLTLFAPDGTLVARNDDRASGDTTSALAITLNATGDFIIEAARFTPPGPRLPGATGSAGSFRLTLAVAGAQVTPTAADPFSQPPPFAVDFRVIGVQEVVGSQLAGVDDRRYFAVRGTQGDLLRALLTRTSGDLVPALTIQNAAGETISRETATRGGETIAYATLPQTGWYLLEAAPESGAGAFDLSVNRIAAAALNVGDSISDTFTPNPLGGNSTRAYLINARIRDRIALTMFTDDNSGQPEITLLDLSLREIGQAEGARFATLRAEIPRSGLYLVQVSSRAAGGYGGGYNLRFSSVPQELGQLGAQLLAYNSQAEGEVSAESPVQFYRFSGAEGELVTVEMQAEASTGLDPYLILMDSDLNEIAANNDTASSRDARIPSLRLPKTGDYVLVASRSGLAGGQTAGAYRLSLTAGAIALEPGVLAFTLNWVGGADLNLFVRDPNGRTVSFANPQDDGGRLQIDSNTDCAAISAQPVEHIYWDAPPPGDYAVWAWAQDGCTGNTADPLPITPTPTATPTAAPFLSLPALSTASTPAPIAGGIPFTLRIRAAALGEPVERAAEIRVGQRFEVTVRVGSDGAIAILDNGVFTLPSPQQIASEGGDMRVEIGQTVEGEITTVQYARFYRLQGAAGQTVTITVRTLAGDLDPLVILRDADNRNLPGGANDDADPPLGENARDSRLTYTLPADGTYIIAVTRFGARDGTTTGAYELSLSG